MDRDLGQVPAPRHRRRGEPPLSLAEPEIDRHLETFHEEDHQQQQDRGAIITSATMSSQVR